MGSKSVLLLFLCPIMLLHAEDLKITTISGVPRGSIAVTNPPSLPPFPPLVNSGMPRSTLVYSWFLPPGLPVIAVNANRKNWSTLLGLPFPQPIVFPSLDNCLGATLR